MRSNPSEGGHRLSHKVSIMQTLAEAEDSDQGAVVPTGYAADTDEALSQAITAGSVATDRDTWQRDLEQWAQRTSPPPAGQQQEHIAADMEDSVSPTSSSARGGRATGSRRQVSGRHARTLSIATTASSTVSYVVTSNATSPRIPPVSENGSTEGDYHRLGLRIPHATQRGTPRKPPSSTRTRKEHIVAGLQGDEWSGSRSLSAEKRAAAQIQQKTSSASSERPTSPPLSVSDRSGSSKQDAGDDTTRSRSSIGAGTTLRLVAETLVSSVAAAAHAVGIASGSDTTPLDAHLLPPVSPGSPAETVLAESELALPVLPGQHHTSRQRHLSNCTTSQVPQSQHGVSITESQPSTMLRPPKAKQSRRPKLSEEQTEQQRLKDAARQAKEQQKAIRWHQRHLAIDAKKAFQLKKDELHTRLSNTRNEDARAEIQWELGELYASYAWGEMNESPGGRDKPALGAGALTHALRVMYEALYSPSRREKGTVPAIAADGNKWARYGQLHSVMWSQGGGKTHLEWAIRAFNEGIKHSGDRTEQAGNICGVAAQAIQGTFTLDHLDGTSADDVFNAAQAGNSPELLQRAITYWQRSTRCDSSDNVKMAWRYVNLAHCYDVLTMMSLAQADKDCDPTVT